MSNTNAVHPAIEDSVPSFERAHTMLHDTIFNDGSEHEYFRDDSYENRGQYGEHFKAYFPKVE